jgi:steroid delta-isomerase-like uncharacterized protein
MSTIETIPTLVSDLAAAWNAHNAEGVLAFYAPEYEGLDVADPAPQYGLDGARESAARYLGAFPGLHVRVEETIVQGDRVVVFWRAWGKHEGAMLHIPATGREVEVSGVSLLTVRDGKVVRARQVWDVAALLRGIGLLPEL